MSVGGGQETRGGFGVPSDVGQSLRGRVNAPGRDLMKTHNARACVPQRGPRGSVGVVRDWIRMLGGGVEVEGTESVAARRGGIIL